jgi:hypothetical protein
MLQSGGAAFFPAGSATEWRIASYMHKPAFYRGLKALRLASFDVGDAGQWTWFARQSGSSGRVGRTGSELDPARAIFHFQEHSPGPLSKRQPFLLLGRGRPTTVRGSQRSLVRQYCTLQQSVPLRTTGTPNGRLELGMLRERVDRNEFLPNRRKEHLCPPVPSDI